MKNYGLFIYGGICYITNPFCTGVPKIVTQFLAQFY